MNRKILISFVMVWAASSIPAHGSGQRRIAFQEASVTIQLLICPPKEDGLNECRSQAKVRDNIAKAIMLDDYPLRSLREERGGIVRFRLLADPENGYRAGACTIVVSSGHEDIDAETCKLLKRRVRFEAQSVNAMQTGIDGRVIWIPSWATTAWDPPEPIIHTNFLFGDASDRPLCWTNKVQREGTGFRVYLDQKQPNFNIGQSPAPEVRPEEFSDGKIGSSFFLAPGERVILSNNPHDACAMKIVQRDGRPAVEQHATFSWH